MSALVTLTTANMDIVYKDMVTKAQQVEVTSYSTNTLVAVSVWKLLWEGQVLQASWSAVLGFLHRQEITVQQIIAHLDSIRKDMVILEKSEFANLRSENTVWRHPPRAFPRLSSTSPMYNLHQGIPVVVAVIEPNS